MAKKPWDNPKRDGNPGNPDRKAVSGWEQVVFLNHTHTHTQADEQGTGELSGAGEALGV